ncbi:SRPBCC domain-containing protein [Kaistella flava (ex Peng et al. 2021)]|uniref:SRPBCC domain-containing protein n=1 Tax=Kaistella flava (ex Peng et al. 2021) TaxID=2038776 RepID=A0A7M2YC70_9FLAO|nr:SRPBCC domain-containing protein [Kaistella flava (ex Peng et al. 2021)]QOW10973.1 SRPBCC domain-containing protein [Kaistella flava (ex Peng et al. 2021)]
MKTEIIFNKDDNSASLYIMKIFHTTVDEVWNHFTKADLLDQWWAPEPWKCQTLKMDFAPEGVWNYAMVGPENEKSFSGVRFHEINFHRSFDYSAFFTDENGSMRNEFPASNWLLGFTGVEEGTKLTVNIHFKTTEDMRALLEMGFEGGFKMGLNQLEELLNKKD